MLNHDTTLQAGNAFQLGTAQPRAERTLADSVRERVAAEPYWFHRIELWPGFSTPGWSDPATEKLPHYGLPQDLTGMRVLDVGCPEGFFSFEAERRGAAEVVAIDSSPESVRRFNICREALGSNVNAYLCNVYHLDSQQFGTFDLVLYYGVLYHLRHPLLALEKIFDVCTGTLLMQSACCADVPGMEGEAMSRFYPFGIDSGPDKEGNPLRDPTVFFMPNRECVRAMVDHVGFVKCEDVSTDPFVSLVLRAQSPHVQQGLPPDIEKAPWS